MQEGYGCKQAFAVSSLSLSLNSEVLEKAQLFSSNVGVSVTGLGSKAAPVAGVFYKQVLNTACLRARILFETKLKTLRGNEGFQKQPS